MKNIIQDTAGFDQLAAELLERIDSGDTFERPQSHWDARAMRHQKLTAADDATLILSTVNRARLDKAILRARALFLAEAMNTNRPLVVAAASTAGRDTIRFDEDQMPHFSLVLRPSGKSDWLVFCTLKKESFPLNSTLEIRDRNGRVWLEGQPDASGQLMGMIDDLEDARTAAKDGLDFFIDGVPLNEGAR